MSTAQDKANMLHENGYSDSFLAECLGVSREHVNRVRNGKKIASAQLEDALNLLLQGLEQGTAYTETPTPTTAAPKPRKKRQAVTQHVAEEEGSTLLSWVVSLVPVGIAVGIAVLSFLQGKRKY